MVSCTCCFSLVLAALLLPPVTRGDGFPSTAEITDSSLRLSHHTEHSETIGYWQVFPYMSFSCECSITGWTFIATEIPQANNEFHEPLQFQLWRWKNNFMLMQVTSIPITRSNINRLSSTSNNDHLPSALMGMSLYEVTLNNSVKVEEGDIFGIFQPNSQRTDLVLQFQSGLAPAHYVRPTNTPTSTFTIRGVITSYDYPLVAVKYACGVECVNGFVSSESVERFLHTAPSNQLINHRGVDRLMPALNFTCDTHITKVVFGAKRRVGASLPQIKIWATSAQRSDAYSLIDGLKIVEVTNTPHPGVYEYTLPEPLPISANNVISLYEPSDSMLEVYSEENSGMFPANVYVLVPGEEEVNPAHSDDDRPLLYIETANEGCTDGFISYSNLVRKAFSLALITDYNLLHVIPDMKFPRTGNITRIFFSGIFLDLTASNTRQYYPEIQVWRLQNGTSGDTYMKVGGIGYVTAPTFSQWINVYEYTMEIPLFVQEGDVLGYYQPPSSESLMGLVSVEGKGSGDYFLYGQNPDSVVLSSPAVGRYMRTPLINFEYKSDKEMPTEIQTNPTGSGGISLTLVIGVAVGGVVGGLVIAGVVFLSAMLWVRARRRGREEKKDGGGENIQNPTYEDNTEATYADPSEVRLPPSSSPHLYCSGPGSPYEQPTPSNPASRVGTLINPGQHNSMGDVENMMNSHAEFAAQLSARAAGKSLVGAGGVQLYEMSSGRDVMNETQDEAVYHDPSEEHKPSVYYSLPTPDSDHLYSDINQYYSSVQGDHMTPSSVGNGSTFFQEEQNYWAPASDTQTLFQQFSSKKYRVLSQHHVSISKHLGSGQFGMVSQGVWSSPSGPMDVAVKTLKPGSSETDKVKFLQEAAISGQFRHLNVVKLIGVVTADQPVMIVLELMSNGDLRNHLVKLKTSNFSSARLDLSHKLLRFCQDIASGMAYLAGKSFVHRDLAARNILMSHDFTCKISDFGLSRDLEAETYYVSRGGKIPIKWTAPEAIHYKKYSTASDVWSYGMVMYEIWSLGEKPFCDFTNAQTVSLLERAFCLPPPPGTPREIYSLMVLCWHPDKSSRPSFPALCSHLSLPTSQLLHWTTEDTAGVGPRALMIGAPLKTAHTLHTNLQTTYNTQH